MNRSDPKNDGRDHDIASAALDATTHGIAIDVTRIRHFSFTPVGKGVNICVP